MEYVEQRVGFVCPSRSSKRAFAAASLYMMYPLHAGFNFRDDADGNESVSFVQLVQLINVVPIFLKTAHVTSSSPSVDRGIVDKLDLGYRLPILKSLMSPKSTWKVDSPFMDYPRGMVVTSRGMRNSDSGKSYALG